MGVRLVHGCFSRRRALGIASALIFYLFGGFHALRNINSVRSILCAANSVPFFRGGGQTHVSVRRRLSTKAESVLDHMLAPCLLHLMRNDRTRSALLVLLLYCMRRIYLKDGNSYESGSHVSVAGRNVQSHQRRPTALRQATHLHHASSRHSHRQVVLHTDSLAVMLRLRLPGVRHRTADRCGARRICRCWTPWDGHRGRPSPVD